MEADSNPAPDLAPIRGTAIPALPNVHSHAFQRAMAGRAERRGPDGVDSFWTWRNQMYAEAETLGPEKLGRVATRLYRELRDRGFSSVAEFHYVHHRPDGTPWADPSTMLAPLVRAADEVGLRLCLLPVLYQRAGFEAAGPTARQRRFVHAVDGYLALLEATKAFLTGTRHRAAIAFHSLRAVALDAITEVLRFRESWDPTSPVHMHVAEQPQEVLDCQATHGRRPIELLLDRFPVDARWCLVHGTHATEDELREVADRGAVIGLCPSTEANLGDGVFDLPAFLRQEGRFGVGTDSHVGVCPFDELRWLEYGQRLRNGRRIVTDQPTDHVGANLWSRALDGGAQAVGLPVGRIAVGHAADVLVFDDPALRGMSPNERLDVLVFRGGGPPPKVWLGGRPVAEPAARGGPAGASSEIESPSLGEMPSDDASEPLG